MPLLLGHAPGLSSGLASKLMDVTTICESLKSVPDQSSLSFTTFPNFSEGKSGFSFASTSDRVAKPHMRPSSLPIGPPTSSTSTMSGRMLTILAVRSKYICAAVLRAFALPMKGDKSTGLGLSTNVTCGARLGALDCPTSAHSGGTGKGTRVADFWAEATVIESRSHADTILGVLIV